MKRFAPFDDEDGATLVEYALLISLLAAVIISVGQVFSTALQGMYLRIAQSLGNASCALT